MPIYKIKSIYVKLYEDSKRVETLDKKTGIIEVTYKSSNLSKYVYLINKGWNFYTLKLLE